MTHLGATQQHSIRVELSSADSLAGTPSGSERISFQHAVLGSGAAPLDEFDYQRAVSLGRIQQIEKFFPAGSSKPLIGQLQKKQVQPIK